MDPAENGGVRNALTTRIGLAVTLVAVVAPVTAQAACSSAVTRASSVASVPPDYLALYQRWGAAYGVPWQLLAAVGSVESRHGRDPGAYVPHTRGVLGPMQFQAGSNKAAQARRRGRRPGVRRHLGHLPQGLRPSALPHGRRRRRDRGGSGEARQRRRQRAAAGRARCGATTRSTRTAGPCSGGRALRHELGLRAPDGSPSGRRDAPATLRLVRRAHRDARPRRRSARRAPRRPEPARHRRDRVRPGRRRRHLPWRRRSAACLAARLDRTAPPHRRHDHPRGHAKYVGGTHKISNHWYGRAATISEVDGEAVVPRLARRGRALGELQKAPGVLRPAEIGSPWASRSTRAGSPAPTRRRRSTSASTPSAPRPANESARPAQRF